MSQKNYLIIFAFAILSLTVSCQGIQSGSAVAPDSDKFTLTPAITPFSILPEITPLPSPSPTPRCEQISGSIDNGQILTKKLDKPMSYLVYLPPCYDHDTYLRYPVIYLLHGQNNTELAWMQLGAAIAANELITTGMTKPFIMVFPFDPSYKQPDQYGFRDVFLGSLIPEIDRVYRTQDDAQHRAIGGISRGGAWALHLGAYYPQMFGAVGAHSPSIFFSDGNDLPDQYLSIPNSLLPRIWIDIGDSDPGVKLITQLHQDLEANNIDHKFYLNRGYHEGEYWAAHLREYLLWYNKGW